MLLSFTKPQDMPGISFPVCISLNCLRSSEAAADVAPAMMKQLYVESASCASALEIGNAICVLTGEIVNLQCDCPGYKRV